MRKSVFVFISIVIVIVGVAWWGIYRGNWFRDKIEEFTKKKTEPALTEESIPGEMPAVREERFRRGLAIKAYKTARATFEDVLPAMGTVKGLITRKLNFEVPGIVEEINFREGDLIKKGELIAKLKQTEAELKIDYNRAKLKSAMTNLSQMEKKLQLHQELYDIGAINRLKLAEVEAETGNARHQVEAAQVEVDSAQTELKKTEMFAPEDCILSDRNIEIGELVSPYSQRVIEVIEINIVYAEIGVVERDIPKIKIGQLARVYVDAYPDIPFDGLVDNVYPALSEKTRTLPLEIKIDNTRRMLMPGMFSRADIILYEKPGVISLPRVSLKKIDDKTQIYVIDEATNTAVERLVETGYESTDYVEITSGVREGELVAITGIDELTSGTPVQITEIQVREM